MESKPFIATTASSATLNTAFLDFEPAPILHTTATGSSGASRIMTRRSRTSMSSEDPKSRASISCVARQMSADDCAKQKFIVWAAIRRNRSVKMAASERLKCPLLRCGERFQDHEAMLRHLTECRHLSTGEYVCYECMRIEVFNDGKCKCCLGHPTKRRRIINMAKNFFSTLGHKSRKDEVFGLDAADFMVPPPSYDSLAVDGQGQGDPTLNQPQLELNGTEILELDSTPLPPAELDSISYPPPRRQQQQQQQPPQFDGCKSTPFPGLEVFPMLPAASPFGAATSCGDSMPPPADPVEAFNTGGSRPSLALDMQNIEQFRTVPRQKYLSPSSSLRSTRSSQGISPISASSGGWTMASTIDTAITSPTGDFSPIGTHTRNMSFNNLDNCFMDQSCPPLPHNQNTSHPRGPLKEPFDSTGNYILDGVLELPGDGPMSQAPRSLTNDPLLFSMDARDEYSWISSNTELSLSAEINMLFTNPPTNATTALDSPSATSTSTSGTRTLVESAWDSLNQHLTCSIEKLAHIQGNRVAADLKTHTANLVASKGLSVLKDLLAGNDPSDPIDFLCFIHLIYAFSLIIHEDDLDYRCNKLFKQALAYRGFLRSEHHADFAQVVSAIWQPASEADDDCAQEQVSPSLSRSSSLKGKEPEIRTNAQVTLTADPLVVVAQNFLDDLENSVINGNSHGSNDALCSKLRSAHAVDASSTSMTPNPAFTITVNYILTLLSDNFNELPGFLPRLKAVSKRVQSGDITTVRKLELELLQAGKNCMPSADLYDEFIPQVRKHCNPIYAQAGFKSRNTFHTLGVELIDNMFQTAVNDSMLQVNNGMVGATEPDPLAEIWKSWTGTYVDDPNSALFDTDTLAFLTPEAPLQQATIDPTNLSHTSSSSQSSKDLMMSDPELKAEQSTNPSDSSPDPSGLSSQKVEAHDCCEICGYRPRGDPQWFKGSMAKHKKLQHSDSPPIWYRCTYPGCNSAYKNRPDNLKQHQQEKNHFMSEDDGLQPKRPSKRKKTSHT